MVFVISVCFLSHTAKAMRDFDENIENEKPSGQWLNQGRRTSHTRYDFDIDKPFSKSGKTEYTHENEILLFINNEVCMNLENQLRILSLTNIDLQKKIKRLDGWKETDQQCIASNPCYRSDGFEALPHNGKILGEKETFAIITSSTYELLINNIKFLILKNNELENNLKKLEEGSTFFRFF